MTKTCGMLAGAVVFCGVLLMQPEPCNSGGGEAEVVLDETVLATVAGLKDTLEKGLRLRRPVEFAFANRVVFLVQTNRLTRKLVLEAFSYARGKRPYPYPYFERVMRARAAQVGVTI